jgi:hypothetical protein
VSRKRAEREQDEWRYLSMQCAGRYQRYFHTVSRMRGGISQCSRQEEEQTFLHGGSRMIAGIYPCSEEEEIRDFSTKWAAREQKFLHKVSRIRSVISQCSEQD